MSIKNALILLVLFVGCMEEKKKTENGFLRTTLRNDNEFSKCKDSILISFSYPSNLKELNNDSIGVFLYDNPKADSPNLIYDRKDRGRILLFYVQKDTSMIISSSLIYFSNTFSLNGVKKRIESTKHQKKVVYGNKVFINKEIELTIDGFKGYRLETNRVQNSRYYNEHMIGMEVRGFYFEMYINRNDSVPINDDKVVDEIINSIDIDV